MDVWFSTVNKLWVFLQKSTEKSSFPWQIHQEKIALKIDFVGDHNVLNEKHYYILKIKHQITSVF